MAAGAKNHGAFVSGVAHLLNSLKKAGIITGKDKGIIQSAAARSSIPHERVRERDDEREGQAFARRDSSEPRPGKREGR